LSWTDVRVAVVQVAVVQPL